MTELRSVAVTTGEPAGIGPEVSLKAAAAVSDPILLIGDRTLLEAEARRLGIAWPLPAHVSIRHVQLRAPAEPGRLDTRNSAYVLDILRAAHEGAAAGEWSAVVTAPVQKSIIIESGVPFTGHTEFFQDLCGVRRVVMMLTSNSPADRQAFRGHHGRAARRGARHAQHGARTRLRSGRAPHPRHGPQPARR